MDRFCYEGLVLHSYQKDLYFCYEISALDSNLLELAFCMGLCYNQRDCYKSPLFCFDGENQRLEDLGLAQVQGGRRQELRQAVLVCDELQPAGPRLALDALQPRPY